MKEKTQPKRPRQFVRAILSGRVSAGRPGAAYCRGSAFGGRLAVPRTPCSNEGCPRQAPTGEAFCDVCGLEWSLFHRETRALERFESR